MGGDNDFPQPNCDAVVLDASKASDLVDHLLLFHTAKGSFCAAKADAFFGSEKTLYRVQEQLLDTAGSLSCLWAVESPNGRN